MYILIVYISGLKKTRKCIMSVTIHVYMYMYGLCAKFGFGLSTDFIVQTTDSYTRYNKILDSHICSMRNTTYILSSLQFAIVPP